MRPPITRRRFLKYSLGVGGTLGLPWAIPVPVARAATGRKLAKYVQALPVPGAGIVVAKPTGPSTYAFRQTQISRQLHPDLPPTPLWAYDDGSGLAGQSGSCGMAVVAQSGTPLHLSYTHVSPLDPGRHEAHASRQSGTPDDASARRLRGSRQRRQPGSNPEWLRPG